MQLICGAGQTIDKRLNFALGHLWPYCWQWRVLSAPRLPVCGADGSTGVSEEVSQQPGLPLLSSAITCYQAARHPRLKASVILGLHGSLPIFRENLRDHTGLTFSFLPPLDTFLHSPPSLPLLLLQYWILNPSSPAHLLQHGPGSRPCPLVPHTHCHVVTLLLPSTIQHPWDLPGPHPFSSAVWSMARSF